MERKKSKVGEEKEVGVGYVRDEVWVRVGIFDMGVYNSFEEVDIWEEI